MNKVFLIGNLTKDPELTENSNGATLCRFSLAVNRRTQSGEKTADFYNATAFRGIAETIAKFCHKGDKIAVCGDVQLRNYEDNQGAKRTAVDIIAQDCEFLSSKAKGEQDDDFYDAPAGGRSASAGRSKKPAIQSFDDDGDIPF